MVNSRIMDTTTCIASDIRGLQMSATQSEHLCVRLHSLRLGVGKVSPRHELWANVSAGSSVVHCFWGSRKYDKTSSRSRYSWKTVAQTRNQVASECECQSDKNGKVLKLVSTFADHHTVGQTQDASSTTCNFQASIHQRMTAHARATAGIWYQPPPHLEFEEQPL